MSIWINKLDVTFNGKRLGVLGILLVASLLIICIQPASAVSLNFLPTDQTVSPGSQATVDVVLSDLDSNLVGAFDFDVNFDPAIIQFDDVAFGTSLGGPAGSFQDSVADLANGNINFAELSLIVDLSALQDGLTDFTLLSLTFDTLGPGTSSLTFSGGIDPSFDFLGDELGVEIALDSVGTGTITVDTPPVGIPEPSSLLLILLGLVPFAACRNQRV